MSPASMLTSKGFATVVDLNLNGTFNMCKAAFDGYMGEHGGKIVNIVAECRNGFPRMVHTGAARSGIINMTKTLAVEWGPYNGIRVNCVAPGTIVSSGMKNYPENVVDMIATNDWMVSKTEGDFVLRTGASRPKNS
jgi:citronellol/citronellal dehydrogenase